MFFLLIYRVTWALLPDFFLFIIITPQYYNFESHINSVDSRILSPEKITAKLNDKRFTLIRRSCDGEQVQQQQNDTKISEFLFRAPSLVVYFFPAKNAHH